MSLSMQQDPSSRHPSTFTTSRNVKHNITEPERDDLVKSRGWHKPTAKGWGQNMQQYLQIYMGSPGDWCKCECHSLRPEHSMASQEAVREKKVTWGYWALQSFHPWPARLFIATDVPFCGVWTQCWVGQRLKAWHSGKYNCISVSKFFYAEGVTKAMGKNLNPTRKL